MTTKVFWTDHATILLQIGNRGFEVPVADDVFRDDSIDRSDDKESARPARNVPKKDSDTNPPRQTKPGGPKFPPKTMVIVALNDLANPTPMVGPVETHPPFSHARLSLPFSVVKAKQKRELSDILSDLRSAVEGVRDPDLAMLDISATPEDMSHGIDIDEIRAKVAGGGIKGFRLLLDASRKR